MNKIIEKFKSSTEHPVTAFYAIVRSDEYSINEVGVLVEHIVKGYNTTFQDKLSIKSDYNNNLHPLLEKMGERELEEYILDKSLILHTPVVEGYNKDMVIDLVRTDLDTVQLTRYFEAHSEEVSRYVLIASTTSNYFTKASMERAREVFFILYGSHVN